MCHKQIHKGRQDPKRRQISMKFSTVKYGHNEHQKHLSKTDKSCRLEFCFEIPEFHRVGTLSRHYHPRPHHLLQRIVPPLLQILSER